MGGRCLILPLKSLLVDARQLGLPKLQRQRTERMGDLQLLQPFFGLMLAGFLLGEPIAWTMIAATAVVVLCVAGAKRFA